LGAICGQQIGGVGEQVIDTPSPFGVGGQVRASVWVGGGPVRDTALTRWNEAGQRSGDGLLVGVLGAVFQEVLCECLMIEPVDRASVGEGFDDVRAGGRRSQSRSSLSYPCPGDSASARHGQMFSQGRPTDALDMAIGGGHAPPGAIFHSYRGAQGGFNWSSQHWLAGLRVAGR